ncbi:hypothetical protein [Paenibacillus sp. FSL W7-1287]|uniref:hypothetical protein n=2 Tax=Paenibacillus TaxID=44249 RepID=UPI0030F5CBBF
MIKITGKLGEAAMKDIYGLIMFIGGFLGLILTYFLSRITGDSVISAIFYIVSFLLIVFGIINDSKKNK